jgi:hypothetical protein
LENARKTNAQTDATKDWKAVSLEQITTLLQCNSSITARDDKKARNKQHTVKTQPKPSPVSLTSNSVLQLQLLCKKNPVLASQISPIIEHWIKQTNLAATPVPSPIPESTVDPPPPVFTPVYDFCPSEDSDL